MAFWLLVILLLAMGAIGAITTMADSTVAFQPAIVIAVFTIILVVYAVYSIKLMRFYRQVPKFHRQCAEGEYKAMIPAAEKMMEKCQTYEQRVKKASNITKTKVKNIPKVINNLHFLLAIAYYAEGDMDRAFEQHVKLLSDDTKDKPLLTVLYHLNTGDLESAEEQYERMDESPEMESRKMLAKGLLLSKQGRNEEAKAIIQEVYPNLQYAYLKDLASQVLSKE